MPWRRFRSGSPALALPADVSAACFAPLHCMRTLTRRRTARRSHHPAVSCDALGRWHWECGCGAGARGGVSTTDWHWMVTAALVHQGACPGE
jgi:hypothetical protein